MQVPMAFAADRSDEAHENQDEQKLAGQHRPPL